mmetsp:Transcript_26109/g.57042  ORF Transcript_26109/g.57042 Transcript_26109/m.57042 type:complete len:451 (-) Transcript_26109:2619-3971(-)
MPHASIAEHLEGKLRPLSLEVHGLCQLVLLTLNGAAGLSNQHVTDRCRVVLLRHTHATVPVLVVDVHIHCLLRLLCGDELSLCLLEAALILQEHSILEVHLRQLGLGSSTSELKCLLEGAALNGVVDRLLQQTQLLEQHRTLVTAQTDSPGIRHLLGRVDTTISLGHTQRILPHGVGPIHLYCSLPVLGVCVVLFSLTQVALRLKLLRHQHVCLRQLVFAVVLHQVDHLVVHAILLVHVDGHIILLALHVSLLSLLELVAGFKLTSFLPVEGAHLCVSEVAACHLLSCLPLAGPAVHVDRVDGHVGLDVVALSLLKVLGGLIVLCNALVVRQCTGVIQEVNDAGCLGELAALDGGLNGLHGAARLNEVVDGGVHLLLGHQPVTPLLLNLNHSGRELAAGQVNGLPVGMAAPVCHKCILGAAQVLVQLTRPLKQPGLGQLAEDGVQQGRVV